MLLVAKNTRYSLQNLLLTLWRNSLVTCSKICLLLVPAVTRCKKSLVTSCEIHFTTNHSLLVAEVARCKKSFVICENNYKSTKFGESFNLFNIKLLYKVK